MLLGPLNVYVSATQEGMLKLWSADTLKPLRAVENGNGGNYQASLKLSFMLVPSLSTLFDHQTY